MRLSSRTIYVLVGGGPDAFETAERIRALVREGARVRVAATAEALRWVGRLTLETVSGAALLGETDATSAPPASALLVAPVDADLLRRLAPGGGFGPERSLLDRHRGRVALVPGEGLGTEPAGERLATLGRLLPPGAPAADVVRAVVELAAAWEASGSADVPNSARDLTGVRIVVTAGPTREHLDPVRFLSNPSTGKMGYALAEAAAERGAEVVLVSGPTPLVPPGGVRCVRVESADEMARAVRAESAFDVFIGAAAVADYRPARPASRKLKKRNGPLHLELVRTEDIIASVAERVRGWDRRPILVGFAAETEAVAENARAKLEQKGLDLVVGNRVGGGRSAFGADDNEAVLVGPEGTEFLPRMSKRELAERILDRVAVLLPTRRASRTDTDERGAK